MSSERIEADRSNIIAFSPRSGKPPQPQNPKRRKLRPLLHALIFVILIAAGFLVVRPAALALRQRMDSLRDQLLRRGEALIGRRIEYEFLEPSFLGGIDVRSLVIRGEGTEPLISVERLHISWSLWDLLRGSEGFPRIRALRIDQPRVYFDYDRDRDLVELLTRLNTAAGPVEMPGALSFRIRDGSFTLAGLGTLDRVDLDAEIRGEWIDAQGAWNIELSLAGPDGGGLKGERLKELFSSLPAFFSPPDLPVLNLSTSARFRLSCDTGLTEGKAYLSVPFIAEDHFRTGALAVDMELRDRVVSLSNVPSGETHLAPAVFALDYGLDTGDFSARLNCRDYSPGDYLRFLDSWQDYRPFLAIRTTGEAYLSFSAEKLVYRTDLSGRIPPSLPLEGSGFRVKLEGDRDRVSFDRIELNLARGARQDNPGGIIGFQGGLELTTLRPRGVLNIRDFSLTGEGGISALLTVQSRGDDLSVFGETLDMGDVVFHDLELDLHRETGGLNFNAGVRRSYGDDGAAVIQADGTFDYAPRHLETRITLDSFSTGDLLGILSPLVSKDELRSRFPLPLADLTENLLQHSQITTEIFATTDFGQILYNAPRLVISYSGGRDMIALFSVSGTDRHFMVDGGQILWDGGSGQITGQSDFSNPDNVSFALTVGYRDMNYSLEGNILDRNSLELWGSYGLNAFMFSTEDGAYSGRAGGENVPIPLGERIARLDFNASMQYLASGAWSVELVNLELADIPGFVPGNTGDLGLLRLAGEANQDRILLREIHYTDSLGALRGGGNFSITGDRDGVRRGTVYAYDDDIGESYDLDISLYPGDRNLFKPGFLPPGINLPSFGELKVRAFGTGMRLDRFSGKIPNTLADGELDLSWKSPEDFNARLDIHSLSANSGGQPVNASGRVFVDNKEFRFEDLYLKLGGLEALAPRLRVDLGESRVEGGGRIWGKISERDIGIDFSLASRFASIASWQAYKTALEDFRGTISLNNMAIDGQDMKGDFDFTFSREGEGLVFSGGPQNMIFFSIKSGGNFVAAFAEPFPLRGVFEGTLNSSSIDAKGEGLDLDLATVWKFLPVRKSFNISSGHAIASLQIRGPLGDPEIYGSARGENLRMQVPDFLADDIVPTQMTLVFDGNEMRFTDVSALCGRGMGVVSGRFWLEKWIPATFSLDITSGRERPLPFRFDVGGILARGTVSGAMNINMMDLVLNVSGDLIAQETEISLDAAGIAASRNEDGYGDRDVPVITDLTITAGRKVEFLWPTRAFPMIQAYADLGARTRIYANSMDRSFSFTGDVKLRGGEIFYFERSFYIRSGILTFREDQNQFDPRITVRAEVRDRSSTGPVTISMVVDNAPLQSFVPRFESSPALSQMEIMSLMGQSLVGAAGEDGSVSNPFLASSTDLLTQSQVMRRIQGALRDFLHLDMFSIRTQFFQRAAFGIMGLQDQPVDRIGWVGNYFDNTSVFVGKYIGSDMFAQLMLSLRYDEKKRSFGGYTLEPDFGIELRSPLGNIQWNLVPSHPENWYINDNSFSISWNFSF
ncbi:MAG: translocation/assembly module TamB domain-containing protein [Treponema sp.]|nr:translocation/assembly module TamB domain-containing protein [Treponema sp.]